MILEILFEDECLVVVNKPAGIVVHPTYRNLDGTLIDELRERCPGASLAAVGRLDKLTSGVVLVAKTAEVHALMQKRWHQADKVYVAVVQGLVEPDRGEIDQPLGTDPADRRRRMIRLDGAPSVTRFECVARSPSTARSLVRCRLLTGRRHQIRVHLAARGWPVVGDAVYGQALPGFPRHALHAWRLVLPHPLAQTAVIVEAPLHADFKTLLSASELPFD